MGHHLPKNLPTLTNALVYLRWSRLSALPSAQNSAVLLSAANLPVVIVEYGPDNTREPIFPTIQLGNHRKWLPKQLHAIADLTTAVWYFWKKAKSYEMPSLIVSHGLGENFAAYWINRITGISYVIYAHETFDRNDVTGWNRLFLKYENSVFQKAKAYIFSHPVRAKIYKQRYKLSRPVYVVPNCTQLIRRAPKYVNLRSELGIKKNSPLIGYWGGIGSRNYIEECVLAIATRATFHLILFGTVTVTEMARLKKIATSHGCDNRIHFMGYVADSDKLSYIAGLDVSLCLYRPVESRLKYSSYSSNKLWESIGVGVPVLASPQEDFWPIVEAYRVGTTLKEVTPKTIAEGIDKLIDHKENLKGIKKRARNLHLSRYNFETQFMPMVRVFEILLQNKKTTLLKNSA